MNSTQAQVKAPSRAQLICRQLMQRPGMTQGELSKATGLGNSQISPYLQRLVRANKIKRQLEKRANTQREQQYIYYPASGAPKLKDPEPRSPVLTAPATEAQPVHQAVEVLRQVVEENDKLRESLSAVRDMIDELLQEVGRAANQP